MQDRRGAFTELLNATGDGFIRLIKIDVEGAELPILENLLHHIDRFPQDVEIVVELSVSERKQESSVRDVIRRFSDLGFACYFFENDYERSQYLERKPVKIPQPFDGQLTKQSDIIFSRNFQPKIRSGNEGLH